MRTATSPPATCWRPGREVLIRAIGEFERKVDIENTIVAIRDGRPILVRDVGRVDDGIREMTNELWINGTPKACGCT